MADEDILKKAQRKIDEAKKAADRARGIEALTPIAPPTPAPKEKTRFVDPGATVISKIAAEITSGDETVKNAKTGYSNIKKAVNWIWNSRLVRWPRQAYMFLWNGTDHKQRKYGATKKVAKYFTRPLLCLFTAAAVANTAGYIVPDTATGGKVIDDVAGTINYFSVEPAYDSARMFGLGIKKETVCLNKYTEIDHAKGVYSANGNEANQPQDGAHSLYFMTKTSLMHHFWSVAKGPTIIFDPNLVVAPIVNGDTHAYEIETYGTRWKSPINALQGYPQLLSVKRLEDDSICIHGSTPNTGADQAQAPATGTANKLPPTMNR